MGNVVRTSESTSYNIIILPCCYLLYTSVLGSHQPTATTRHTATTASATTTTTVIIIVVKRQVARRTTRGTASVAADSAVAALLGADVAGVL